MSIEMSIQDLGKLIDDSMAHENLANLEELDKLCLTKIEKASSIQRVVLYFYQANICSAKLNITKNTDPTYWTWDEEDKTQELFLLRKAIAEPDFKQAPKEIRLKIYTNLANSLSSVGRAFEAYENWDVVLKEIPNFAMALGNKAWSLGFMADNLYDSGHKRIYFKHSEWGFLKALEPNAYWDSGFEPRVADHFGNCLMCIPFQGTDEEIKAIYEPSKWNKDVSEEEAVFINWALENCLYLNPLNDLHVGPVASTDVFHLPNHTYENSETPKYVYYYDVLKQEYSSARALFYEAIYGESKDYAHKNNLQFESFDGSLYGLQYDKLKLAYRSAYSIFDKLAVFINDYFKLKKDLRYVSFRSIWYLSKDSPDIHPLLTERPNWALRALYALSQDLFDKKFNSVAQPDAQYLDKLRNAAEHRFLTIHDREFKGVTNKAHMHIELENFKSKVMRLLKLSRAALVYLSISVLIDERWKAKKKNAGDQGIPIKKGVPKKKS